MYFKNTLTHTHLIQWKYLILFKSRKGVLQPKQQNILRYYIQNSIIKKKKLAQQQNFKIYQKNALFWNEKVRCLQYSYIMKMIKQYKMKPWPCSHLLPFAFAGESTINTVLLKELHIAKIYLCGIMQNVVLRRATAHSLWISMFLFPKVH